MKSPGSLGNLNNVKELESINKAKALIKERREKEIDFKDLSEYAWVEVAKLLIEARKVWVLAKNLDKIPESKVVKIVKLIIETEDSFIVACNLEKIPETKIVEVVQLLIKAGEGESIADHLDLIPESKKIKVVELLIKAGEGESVAYNLDKIPEEYRIEIIYILIKAGKVWAVADNLDKISESKIAEVINLLIEKGGKNKPLLIYFLKNKNEIKKENIIKINEYLKQNYQFNNLEEIKIYTEQKVKDFWNSKMFDINDERNSLVSEMIAKYIPKISKEDFEYKIKECNETNIEIPFDERYRDGEIEVVKTNLKHTEISKDTQEKLNDLNDLTKLEDFNVEIKSIKSKLTESLTNQQNEKIKEITRNCLSNLDLNKLNSKQVSSVINQMLYLRSKIKGLDNNLRKIFLIYSLRKENKLNNFKDLFSKSKDIETIQEVKEFIQEIIIDGQLSKYLDEKDKKDIQKLFYINAFNHQISNIEKTKTNQSLKIKFHPSKDILTNLAGSIGYACYSNVNILKEAPNVNSITFLIDDKPIGSTIFHDTTDTKGNKITILRALNPQIDYLNNMDVNEFCDKFFQYFEDICQSRGSKPCIVLDDCLSAATNRDPIWNYIKKLKSNKKVETKEVDFRHRRLFNQSIYQIS